MGKILLGNIKGPKGDTGDIGPQGEPGPKGDPGESSAINTTYDNTNSGLQAENVQDAIDEIKESIPTKAEDIGADVSGSANTALESAKSYTDTKISDLINGAPEAMDTLKEVADAMTENDSVVEALNAAIGNKANTSDLTAHMGDKNNPHGVTAEQIGAVSETGDNSNTTTTFNQATTRANISTGEKLSVIMGKISKWFADLKTVAFTGSYTDLSNKPAASDIGAMPDIITITEYPYNGITDILKLPIGRYRFPNSSIWQQFENIPMNTTGMIEVNSFQGGNPDPFSQTWAYKNYIYISSLSGIINIRTLNSRDTVENISDTGWVNIIKDSDILDTSALINSNTSQKKVAGALVVKELNTNLQNTIYSNGGALEEKVKYLIENKKLPVNKPFMIKEGHSGNYTYIGHIYDSWNYGGFLVITFSGTVYSASVSNGTLASLTKIGDYAEIANKATNDSNGRNISTGYMKHYDGNVTTFNAMKTRGKYLVNGTYKASEGAPWDGVLYGVLYVFLCDDTRTHNETSTWLMQLLFDTYGNIKIRRKINADGWSSWNILTNNNQILNTATAIKASTSSDNIVGVQGLKEMLTKKYGTLTVVNADSNSYSYVRMVGDIMGILKVTCSAPAIDAWGESILYTSSMKPSNEIVFLLVRQDDRQVLRCVFNTNGEVIAQAKGASFPGGWVGGSCSFM